MQHEQASRTALLIAASLVLLHHDAKYSRLVSKTSADLCAYVLTGIEASARSFRGLIDLAIARGGSYYLTYHKFAKPEQVMACYPQFKEFLDLKRKYDPAERFQSDWYRYYRKLFTS